jgi:hypothetical protein
MAITRQHRKTDKAIGQSTDSYEVTVDVLVVCSTVDTLHIEEWLRMRSIHLTNWQI